MDNTYSTAANSRGGMWHFGNMWEVHSWMKLEKTLFAGNGHKTENIQPEALTKYSLRAPIAS
jgi:hypothetical protein